MFCAVLLNPTSYVRGWLIKIDKDRFLPYVYNSLFFNHTILLVLPGATDVFGKS